MPAWSFLVLGVFSTAKKTKPHNQSIFYKSGRSVIAGRFAGNPIAWRIARSAGLPMPSARPLVRQTFAGVPSEQHIIAPRDPHNAVANFTCGAKAALET